MCKVNDQHRRLVEHYRDWYPASVAVRPATSVTCRYYELRCQTGVVAGNYSSGNTLVPYAIAPSQLEPVYQFQTVSNEPPADSFGRMFPGNVLNSSQLLFTDCWNTTDSLVWTQSLHLYGIYTAAGMQAGMQAGAQSVRMCPAVPHTCMFSRRHGVQDGPACCSIFTTCLQASWRTLPSLMHYGNAVHH